MNNTNSLHLIAVGNVKGTPASELKVGDRLMWNYGYVSTVTSIEQRGKSVYVTELCKDGNSYSRRFLKTRLVARIAS